MLPLAPRSSSAPSDKRFFNDLALTVYVMVCTCLHGGPIPAEGNTCKGRSDAPPSFSLVSECFGLGSLETVACRPFKNPHRWKNHPNYRQMLANERQWDHLHHRTLRSLVG